MLPTSRSLDRNQVQSQNVSLELIPPPSPRLPRPTSIVAQIPYFGKKLLLLVQCFASQIWNGRIFTILVIVPIAYIVMIHVSICLQIQVRYSGHKKIDMKDNYVSSHPIDKCLSLLEYMIKYDELLSQNKAKNK